MFDSPALFDALDDRRALRGLSWDQVAGEVSALAMPPVKRRDERPPISVAALTNLVARGDTSCQHALSMLRWLDRCPEEFVFGAPAATLVQLPDAAPHQRLCWHIHHTADRSAPGLFECLDEQRRDRGLSWPALAPQLRSSARQLNELANTRFAVRMSLVIEITQWLKRPAADFVYVTDW